MLFSASSIMSYSNAPNKKEPIFGLDFGTCSCHVSVFRNGAIQPVRLTDDDPQTDSPSLTRRLLNPRRRRSSATADSSVTDVTGRLDMRADENALPSVVHFADGGERVSVGAAAVAHLTDRPQHTIAACKRLLGLDYSTQVRRERERAALLQPDDADETTHARGIGPAYQVSADDQSHRRRASLEPRHSNNEQTTVNKEVEQTIVKEDKKQTITNGENKQTTVADDNEEAGVLFTLDFGAVEMRLRPAEVCLVLLREVVRLVQRRLGLSARRAVVSTPVCYTQRQRAALRVAASAAGIELMAMLASPTAALYYRTHNVPPSDEPRGTTDSARLVAVLDAGGGQCSAQLISVQPTSNSARGKAANTGVKFRVLASAGDCCVGGLELDDALLQHCLSDIEQRYNIDVTGDAVTVARIRAACVDAKHAMSLMCNAAVCVNRIPLTHKQRAQLTLPAHSRHNSEDSAASSDTGGECEGAAGWFDYVHTIRQAQFEEVCGAAVRRCFGVLVRCITESGYHRAEVHQVLLAGGTARVPLLRHMIREYMDDRLPVQICWKGLDLVSRGLSLYAACLARVSGAPNYTLLASDT